VSLSGNLRFHVSLIRGFCKLQMHYFFEFTILMLRRRVLPIVSGGKRTDLQCQNSSIVLFVSSKVCLNHFRLTFTFFRRVIDFNRVLVTYSSYPAYQGSSDIDLSSRCNTFMSKIVFSSLAYKNLDRLLFSRGIFKEIKRRTWCDGYYGSRYGGIDS
jgi:hypothetical protein